jgi:hypothetical protein
VTNYLIGNDPARWVRGISNDSEVVYPQIYPGIELVFHGTGDLMEHDFRIAPGADPDVVLFVLDGAHNMTLDSAGNLSFSVAGAAPLVFERRRTSTQRLGKSSQRFSRDGGNPRS